MRMRCWRCFDHALQKEAGNEEARDAGTQTSRLRLIETGKSHHTREAQNGQHQTSPEIVADMARLAKSGLDEPRAGSGDVGGRERDGLTDGFERLFQALFHPDCRLLGSLRCLPAQSAEAGSQHGTGRNHGSAKGEHHQHDGHEHDDGQNHQRHR